MNNKFVHEPRLVRPDGIRILEDIQRKCGNTHPRLMADREDFDALSSAIANEDLILRRLFELLRQKCEELLKTEPPVYYVDEGNRLLTTSRRVMNCILPLALMYNITGEQEYAERAWSEMDAACGFPDWHPSHYLDTAELAFGIGVGYDWLYEYINDEQRKKVQRAIELFAIDSAEKCFDIGGGWTDSENNWNEVCCAGIFSACAAVCDVMPEKSARLMEKLVRAIENGAKVYAPDGGYIEGPVYWCYGTDYFVNFLSVLTSVCGTDYGFCTTQGLRETMYFPSFMESDAARFNFHDCGEEFSDTACLMWLAGAFDEPAVGALRANEVLGGKKQISYKDILYYRPERISDKKGLDCAKCFYGIDTAVMRSGWESGAVYVGLHGGANSAGHGDLDIGQFVYDALGERWFCDLGGEYYNVEGYWDGDSDDGMRWSYYKKRAEGHNTLVINPDERGGQEYAACGKITEFIADENGAAATVDLYTAYKSKVEQGAKRTVKLCGRTVTISDEIKLLNIGEIYWFAHMRGVNATLAPDGRGALLKKNGKCVGVRLESADESLRFEIMNCRLLSGRAPRAGEHCLDDYKKLAIHGTGKKEFSVSVIIEPKG